MLSYILRRALQSVVVLLVVGLVAFSMFRFVGDPVDNLLGQERTDADIERLRDTLGLNDPFPVQYWDFLTRAASGDLGVSFRQGRPVLEIFFERAPATLELAAISALFALVFAVAVEGLLHEVAFLEGLVLLPGVEAHVQQHQRVFQHRALHIIVDDGVCSEGGGVVDFQQPGTKV